MAKYLDTNGLSYFWQKLKQAFSFVGHTHTVSVTPGTAASLTTDDVSIPSISSKTVVISGTKTAIPNVSVTERNIPNVTSAGSAAVASVSGGVLTITDGVAPTLGSEISVGSASLGAAIEAYTSLSTGDSITVGTPMTVKAVDTFTPNVPTVVDTVTGASTS